MQLVPRGVPALLTIALAAGVTAGAGLASPAAAAGVAPTGTYSLDTTSIYAAQTVLLTQTSLADDIDPADSIARVVNWGDGTSQTLQAAATKPRHAYATTGTFTVSVQLTDSEGNVGAGTIVGAAAVSVSAVAGTYKLDKTSAWSGKKWTTKHDFWNETATTLTLRLSSVPTNVARVRITWGDDLEQLVARGTSTVKHFYYSGGSPYKVTVSLENEHGRSAEKTAGTLKVKLDDTAPQVWITTPKKSNRVSSWKTIKGTGRDRNGTGLARVRIAVVQLRATTVYFYRFTTKRWAKLTTDNPPASGMKWVKASSNGAWKVSVSGLRKGHLWVDAYGEDKTGNWSNWVEKAKELTR
jgi:hypothetical protein